MYSEFSATTNILSTIYFKIFHLSGRNARISNNGLSATRPNALGEFNDAIVMSNRPLRDDEVFEIVIEQTVDRWSGSIEAGVTLIRPEDLDFPNTVKISAIVIFTFWSVECVVGIFIIIYQGLFNHIFHHPILTICHKEPLIVRPISEAQSSVYLI